MLLKNVSSKCALRVYSPLRDFSPLRSKTLNRKIHVINPGEGRQQKVSLVIQFHLKLIMILIHLISTKY